MSVMDIRFQKQWPRGIRRGKSCRHEWAFENHHGYCDKIQLICSTTP